jgi:hypothetical protein
VAFSLGARCCEEVQPKFAGRDAIRYTRTWPSSSVNAGEDEKVQGQPNAEVAMSVTTVFRCFHDDVLKHWINDREHFDEKNHPGCESIQLGVESLAVADLVARAKNKQSLTPLKDFLFNMIVGTIGTSVHDDGDYPRIINTGDVARANRLLSEIKPNDLREIYNLERLKADHLEIEEYGLWDLLGPNILDNHLIPMFERIGAFFHLAAERKQQVVVSWF